MEPRISDVAAFVAVVEEGTITGAAARLRVAQPALTRQLQSLERNLGVALLDRTPRGAQPTDAGRAFFEHGRALVASWEAGREASRRAADAQRLVIGIQTAVGRLLHRGLLARFAEMHPQVRPVLRLVDWQDPTSGLADRSSDVAIVWAPVIGDDIDFLPLASEPRLAVLPASHPLATREEVTMADLADEPFVALPDDAGELRDYWLATDARGGRPARIGAVAATPDEAFEAVASSLGVMLIAAGNAQLYSRENLRTIPVGGIEPATLAIAWRGDDRRRIVADFVRAALDDADHGK